jgi:putative acetyltransferase
MPAHDVDIVPFRPEHAEAFSTLNRAWLISHGLFESHDDEQLRDPVGTILSKGGEIFVALAGGAVVGTSAIKPHTAGTAELVKLTVAEPVRGRGLGRRLVETCVEHARNAGMARVTLVSSSRLVAALALYESLGFVHKPLPSTQPYVTADVYMELDLGLALPDS